MLLRVKRMTACAVMTAATLIVGYMEYLMPLPIALPGVKLGLANALTVTAMYVLGLKAAFAISMVRVLLSGFMFAGLGGLMYALAGALLSFAGMATVMRCSHVSVVGVSVTGAVLHNAAQYMVAAAVVHTAGLAVYLPVLVAAGAFTGIVVGLIAHALIKRLNASDMFGHER